MSGSRWVRGLVRLGLVAAALLLAVMLPGLLDDAWLAMGLIMGALLLLMVSLIVSLLVRLVRR